MKYKPFCSETLLQFCSQYNIEIAEQTIIEARYLLLRLLILNSIFIYKFILIRILILILNLIIILILIR